MKKRIVSFVMIVILVVCILPMGAFAGSLSYFSNTRTYITGQFSDVSNQWYAQNVKAAYEFGLIDGSSATTFSPDKNLMLSEAIKLAACLNSMYHTGSINFAVGTPWYQPYVDYALSNGIIQSPYPNYNVYATRSDMAIIFANALPDEAMTAINTISDNTIPDVMLSYTYGSAVYKLYRAGILTGGGDTHAYKPNDNITRAEVAAIVSRMASSSSRVTFTISATTKELSATEIAKKCLPAVFYIELYNSTGTAYASGSGFFINSDGLAVTNFHVIDGASSAKIMTSDGAVYNVAGVYDYNEEYDLALLQITGSGFPYLELGDSSTVVTGATVYAIGSPKGLDNTFSQGIVSNASRKFTDSVVNFIQIDAAISHGSSGGALINTSGQVIGVTAAGRDDAQNINFAVPVNLIPSLKQTSVIPLSSINPQLKYTVTTTPSTIIINKGTQTTITVTDVSLASDSCGYKVEDSSIASCSWGDWSANYDTIPLSILGLAVGTTKISVYLYDANDKIIAATTVNITVNPSNVPVPLYNGYALPDFGAYVGTPSYDSFYSNTLGGGHMYYFYKLSEINGDIVTAVDGYLNFLEAYGYVFTDSYKDANGTQSFLFESSTCYMSFIVGTDNLNNEPNICIAVANKK